VYGLTLGSFSFFSFNSSLVGGFGVGTPVSPMKTVPTATTVPIGKSAGSLHVLALSPFLAAGLLFMNTPVLPTMTFPWFVGGFWKLGPPIGICAGVLVAVLLTNAAGFPSMNTSWLRLLSIIPLKGCGVGVGTGPPGEGTITI